MASFELKSLTHRQHQSKYVTFFHQPVNVWSNRNQIHRPPSYLEARSPGGKIPGGKIPLVYVLSSLLQYVTQSFHLPLRVLDKSHPPIQQEGARNLRAVRCFTSFFFSLGTDVDVYPTRCQLKRQSMRRLSRHRMSVLCCSSQCGDCSVTTLLGCWASVKEGSFRGFQKE